ncbi:EamA family transporter RarD [Enemella sp. A6]|uniref:EamA family transporter RarD n=1 Tax=Enemella sp. A6 TaxID=3440152 RepID=UPI003EBD2DBC
MVTELTPHPADGRRGVLAALAAYVLWGLTPLFWPLLGDSSAVEVLAHRYIWSSVMALGLGLILGVRWWQVLRRRRTMIVLSVAALLISVNWGTYIWAVNNQHALDAALGYYINPLLSVVAGVVLLRERLSPLRWLAVGVALVGVTWMTIQLGQVPWVALVLATSFAIYGVIKKRIRVEPIATMTIESLLITPFALAFLIWLAVIGQGGFATKGLGYSLLFVATGAMSLTPLLLFAIAAQKISLFAIGMLQYIAPTAQMLIGIYYLGEPMSPSRLMGFAVVWVALVIVSIDSLLAVRRQRRLRRAG